MSSDPTPHKAAQALVRDLVANDPLQGWDQAWYDLVSEPHALNTCLFDRRKVKATPWDAGEVQPPLRDLLHSGVLQLPPAGRALVPGCGKVSSPEVMLYVVLSRL